MAIESMTKLVYSEKSDVWSWAVTVWECITRSAPFADLTNVNVIMAVTGGKHLPIPTNCSPTLAKLMTSCWDKDPSKRPTFEYILQSVIMMGDTMLSK